MKQIINIDKAISYRTYSKVNIQRAKVEYVEAKKESKLKEKLNNISLRKISNNSKKEPRIYTKPSTSNYESKEGKGQLNNIKGNQIKIIRKK